MDQTRVVGWFGLMIGCEIMGFAKKLSWYRWWTCLVFFILLVCLSAFFDRQACSFLRKHYSEDFARLLVVRIRRGTKIRTQICGRLFSTSLDSRLSREVLVPGTSTRVRYVRCYLPGTCYRYQVTLVPGTVVPYQVGTVPVQ
jgi:hypothetical protein